MCKTGPTRSIHEEDKRAPPTSPRRRIRETQCPRLVRRGASSGRSHRPPGCVWSELEPSELKICSLGARKWRERVLTFETRDSPTELPPCELRWKRPNDLGRGKSRSFTKPAEKSLYTLPLRDTTANGRRLCDLLKKKKKKNIAALGQREAEQVCLDKVLILRNTKREQCCIGREARELPLPLWESSHAFRNFGSSLQKLDCFFMLLSRDLHTEAGLDYY